MDDPKIETAIPNENLTQEEMKSFWSQKPVQIWTAVIGGVLFAVLLLVVVLYFATSPKKTTTATGTPTPTITSTNTPTPTDVIEISNTPTPTLEPTATPLPTPTAVPTQSYTYNDKWKVNYPLNWTHDVGASTNSAGTTGPYVNFRSANYYSTDHRADITISQNIGDSLFNIYSYEDCKNSSEKFNGNNHMSNKILSTIQNGQYDTCQITVTEGSNGSSNQFANDITYTFIRDNYARPYIVKYEEHFAIDGVNWSSNNRTHNDDFNLIVNSFISLQ